MFLEPPPVAPITAPTSCTVEAYTAPDLSSVAIRIQSTIERMLPFAQGDDGSIYLLPATPSLTEPMLRMGLAELQGAGLLLHARLEGSTGIAVLAQS